MLSNTPKADEGLAASGSALAQPPITVIGIGNSLMTDDGAGVHVAMRLASHVDPQKVRVLDGGTLSFTLLDEVEQTDYLIIVDAAELDAEPGTVQAFHDKEMDAYLSNSVRPSVHEVNLLDVLTAARLRRTMPAHYSLVGIQPHALGWGTEPSDVLKPAIDKAHDLILGLIESSNAEVKK